MRLVFCARPAYGHVYPLIPLAMAARAAGHEVTFATTGGFLPLLARIGFAVEDVGLTIEPVREQVIAELATEPAPPDPRGRPDFRLGARLFFDRLAPATIADLGPVLRRRGADAVIYDQYDVGAGVAAHAAGVPAVAHAVSPRWSGEVLEPIVGAWRSRLWDRAGVSTPSIDPFVGDVHLDITPSLLQAPDFRDHPARLPIRPVAFAEPDATLPAWVGHTGRPLVYLTLGTIVATDERLRPAIDAAATLGADVLVALGAAEGDDLGHQPDHVHVARFVDQRRALEHADLAVHHGGSGTLLAAVAAGVPQLLLPKGADQFFNADRVRETGVAPALDPAEATPARIAALAAELLDHLPAPAAVARTELRAMPAPHRALRHLVQRLTQLGLDDRDVA